VASAFRRKDEASTRKTLYLGSHLDTVPRAGAFDGILGVMLAIALVELLRDVSLPFAIEVVGFSEEEGVRFGVPFIGSRALAGTLDDRVLQRHDASGRSVADAIAAFGLDPLRLPEARVTDEALGYLEFHIEQGPVLEAAGLPLGVVDVIVGQRRLDVLFTGAAGHAGTTPMALRRDALAGLAEWILDVERVARTTDGLVATVGRVDVEPGAGNVIAGACRASLDVRHRDDGVRTRTVERLLEQASEIGARRRLDVGSDTRLDQASVPMDATFVERLARAVQRTGATVYRMSSGAGHDAMILAPLMPAAMLFVRSPRGLSHHPDESVLEADVAAALAAGRAFVEDLAATAHD
jgi:allantoate deiminase